ncbi:hypothetical protein HanIR_Chr01g0037041 [Helianthus annuus]|nr:hypothetical protein HanIR_Chr01g0037041 [Helianthus annuus]
MIGLKKVFPHLIRGVPPSPLQGQEILEFQSLTVTNNTSERLSSMSHVLLVLNSGCRRFNPTKFDAFE